MKFNLFLFLSLISVALKAQQPAIQYFRPYSKEGLNVFETTKNDSTLFTGLKVRVGGNFTQDFQGLRHQNNATPVFVATAPIAINLLRLPADLTAPWQI